jgi:hypothetical protein
MIYVANRAIRHGVVGFQHQIDQNVSNGDGIGINGCQIHGEAFRLWTLALLIGISGILMLLGMNSTADKPCVLCKAEHRLRKKDENRAEAQRKKLIFAGDFHEASSYLRVSSLSTPAPTLHRAIRAIEAALCRRKKSFFSLKENILLYNLTSPRFAHAAIIGWWPVISRRGPTMPEGGACAVKPAAGVDGAQTLVLCWSEGRTLKDRAVRESAGTFLSHFENLRTSRRFGPRSIRPSDV